MIRIDAITLREIHLPLVEPFRSARGETTRRRILLLELRGADGAVAWSECVAQADPSYSPDTVDTSWLAIHEWLAPRLVGRGVRAPRDAHELLTHGIRGHHMARAAVEMGVWALAAMIMDVPLARALAGASGLPEGAEPRTHVASGLALGMQGSPEEAARRARAAFAEGYQRVKLKIGPADAIAVTGAVRAAVGAGANLTADANSSFSLDDAHHVATLEALDDFGLAMLEQPLAPDGLVRHAELQRRIRTPICLDESITSRDDARDMVTLGSGRAVNLKAGRVGGLTEALAIHALCVGARLGLWCGGMLESGIGRAYNVALASLPGFTAPGDLSPSARYWARDVVTPAWTMDADGRVAVPLDRPGIGVEVDVDFIDDCTVRTAEVRAP